MAPASGDMPLSTRIGHGLAWIFQIDLRPRPAPGNTSLADDKVTRGESVFSVSSADTYIEEEPRSIDWIREIAPSGRDILRYLHSLFPFTHWILRYNLVWLVGDLVAGITVGAVVVPQGMAYAQLALLPVQFGLYSSFMGVLIYWFFATSKDITIGPVAVMSTLTGNIIQLAQSSLGAGYPPQYIASALAIIAGAIVFFIGVIRCGWIVDLISLAAISAFMTGSALNIAVGQVPSLMGIPSTVVNNRDSTYLVVIHILQHLNACRLDAAMGLTALAMLYIIRSACNYAARRNPARAKAFFFLSTLRTAFVILLYTLISWLVNMYHRGSDQRFKILGDVPRGFQNAGVPVVNSSIISAFSSQLPAAVIVLLIEHISIAKSFGRVNNYTIDPSQELVAIGVTNLLAPFLGAYPATGSFSRTAIKSKAGVRTPFAGVITAIVVLLAIYALPPVFFYIPQASLSGVIIHAVGDLITPPNTVYQFWRISPFEMIIFFAGVIVTVFTTIEIGVYVTVSSSMALYLFRAFKAKGRFLGRVKVHSVLGDHILNNDGAQSGTLGRGGARGGETDSTRNIFLPISHLDGSNPEIEVEKPYPGIFIYRFSEGFNYPNANHYFDSMVQTIFRETRRTNPTSWPRPGDRPWNDPGPRKGEIDDSHLDRPDLKAIILDFSSVNNVDITSVQHLIDVRNQLDRYTSPNRVDWHFAHINNRWTKRALVAAGFGYLSPPASEDGSFPRWKPIFSVAEIGGSSSVAAFAEQRLTKDLEASAPRVHHTDSSTTDDDRIEPDNNGIGGGGFGREAEGLDKTLANSKAYEREGRGGRRNTGAPTAAFNGKIAVASGLNRPMFHLDLTSALQSAIANAERKPGQ